jgi:hypothetical protein
MNLLNVLPRARAARLQPDQLEPPTHYRLPATYSGRQNVEAGGLMSYGASAIDAHRQMGVYVDRILRGRVAARGAGAIGGAVSSRLQT